MNRKIPLKVTLFLVSCFPVWVSIAFEVHAQAPVVTVCAMPRDTYFIGQPLYNSTRVWSQCWEDDRALLPVPENGIYEFRRGEGGGVLIGGIWNITPRVLDRRYRAEIALWPSEADQDRRLKACKFQRISYPAPDCTCKFPGIDCETDSTLVTIGSPGMFGYAFFLPLQEAKPGPYSVQFQTNCCDMDAADDCDLEPPRAGTIGDCLNYRIVE